MVAKALGDGVASREELTGRVAALIGRLSEAGAVLKLPPQGLAVTVEEGLAPLIRRGLVTEGLQPVAAERALVAFYAASVPDGNVAASPQT